MYDFVELDLQMPSTIASHGAFIVAFNFLCFLLDVCFVDRLAITYISIQTIKNNYAFTINYYLVINLNLGLVG